MQIPLDLESDNLSSNPDFITYKPYDSAQPTFKDCSEN